MKYLSDTSSDYAALEAFIASGACGELLHKERNSWFHVPEYLAAFEPLADRIHEHLLPGKKRVPNLPDTLPTRYDNPFAFSITRRLVASLKKACASVGLEVPAFPEFACIPTGIINAYAAKVPNCTKTFLLFDSQIYFYCNLWAKVLATAQPIVGIGKMISTSPEIGAVRKHLDRNNSPVNRLRELLDASVAGAPSDAPAYLPDPNYVPLASLLRESMEAFLVAHEFGHVYANHLGPLLSALPAPAQRLIESANDSQRMEYEADAIAFSLTVQLLLDRGFDAALSSVGPPMFFAGLEILDGHYRRKGYSLGSVESPSHPTNSDRQAMLAELSNTFFEPGVASEATSLRKSFSAIARELESRLDADA